MTNEVAGGVAIVQVLGTVLLGVLSYLGIEIRKDVKDMRDKVSILWDRYERRGKNWDGVERRAEHIAERGD